MKRARQFSYINLSFPHWVSFSYWKFNLEEVLSEGSVMKTFIALSWTILIALTGNFFFIQKKVWEPSSFSQLWRRTQKNAEFIQKGYIKRISRPKNVSAAKPDPPRLEKSDLRLKDLAAPPTDGKNVILGKSECMGRLSGIIHT